MRELWLITTGATQGDGPAAGAASSEVRLRWRRDVGHVPGWRDALARRLGADELLATAAARLVSRALAPRGEYVDAREQWLLTPVRLVAGLDRVFMPADALVELPAAQWQRLCADFERELGGGTLRLRPVAGGAALLDGTAFGPLQTHAPERGLGRDLRALQPTGAGAARWRALQGEIEMWLHAHPLNRERAAAGLAAVTSLWLWGGPSAVPTGAAPRDGATVAAPAREAWQVQGADPWLAALPQLLPRVRYGGGAGAGLATLATDARESVAVLLPAASRRADLVDCWLEPAQRQLAAGSIGRLTLWTPAATWRLVGSDRWRLWRSARGWQEVLTVSDD